MLHFDCSGQPFQTVLIWGSAFWNCSISRIRCNQMQLFWAASFTNWMLRLLVGFPLFSQLIIAAKKGKFSWNDADISMMINLQHQQQRRIWDAFSTSQFSSHLFAGEALLIIRSGRLSSSVIVYWFIWISTGETKAKLHSFEAGVRADVDHVEPVMDNLLLIILKLSIVSATNLSN